MTWLPAHDHSSGLLCCTYDPQRIWSSSRQSPIIVQKINRQLPLGQIQLFRQMIICPKLFWKFHWILKICFKILVFREDPENLNFPQIFITIFWHKLPVWFLRKLQLQLMSDEFLRPLAVLLEVISVCQTKTNQYYIWFYNNLIIK